MLTDERIVTVFDEASPQAAALATSSTPELIERIFTDQLGRKFRMVFMVALVDGEIKGRLVSVQPLSACTARLKGDCASSGTLCLPVNCPISVGDTAYIAPATSFVSPYISLEFLMTSQPTRAPSK